MHVGPFSFPWKLVRWSVLDDLNRTWFTFGAREKVNQVFSQTDSLSLSPKRTCSVHNLKLKLRRFDFLSFSRSHWFSGFPKEKSFNLAWMRSIGWQQWSSKRSPVVGHWGSRSTEKISFIVESFVQQRCQMCQIQFLPIFLIVQVKVALYTVHFPRIMQWAVRVFISKVRTCPRLWNLAPARAIAHICENLVHLIFPSCGGLSPAVPWPACSSSSCPLPSWMPWKFFEFNAS